MAVLMRDVARKAGVSVTTVSHVLNDTRNVAIGTRQRVQRAANDLNYFKNTSARLLVRGESDLVGLVISDIENPFFPELIKGFERACYARNLEVLLSSTNYDRQQSANAVRRMLEHRVRGVAVMTSQFDAGLQHQLSSKGVPSVLLSSPFPKRLQSVISIDYSQGITACLKYLKEQGHELIALALGPSEQVSAAAYRDVLLRCMRRLQLQPFGILYGDHTPDSGAEITRTLLSARQRPTAIICGNDRMAVGAVGVASELGFRVPDDVSIIGSDDVWITRYCHPSLTTIRIPREKLGQMAFDTLYKMIGSKSKRGVEHVLETELVIRRSSAAAPSRRSRTKMKRVEKPAHA